MTDKTEQPLTAWENSIMSKSKKTLATPVRTKTGVRTSAFKNWSQMKYWCTTGAIFSTSADHNVVRTISKQMPVLNLHKKSHVLIEVATRGPQTCTLQRAEAIASTARLRESDWDGAAQIPAGAPAVQASQNYRRTPGPAQCHATVGQHKPPDVDLAATGPVGFATKTVAHPGQTDPKEKNGGAR